MLSRPARAARRALILSLALFGLACSEGDGAAPPAPTGDVRLVEAAVPAEGAAGHLYDVYAKVVADAPKWNVTVVLALAPLGEGEEPSDVDPAQVPPGARVWSAVIDRMDAGIPVALHEDVALPAGLEAGRYAAILQLEAVDFTAEDDHLQGEEAEHRENNTFVVTTPVVITRPELPDVEFVSFFPAHYDVALQSEDADAALLGVNVELAARTHPVENPLELEFELGIPDAGGELQWFPLQVSGPDGEDGDTGPQDRYDLAPTAQVLPDGTPVTATLVPDRARGLHLELYAPDETRAALAALTEPIDCELRARVDPAGLLTEHEEEDNQRVVWLRAFPPGSALDATAGVFGDGADGAEPVLTSSSRPMVRAAGVDLENPLYTQIKDWSAGNDEFGARFFFSAHATYGTSDRTPIGAGDRIVLYDSKGLPVGNPSTPWELKLEDAGNGRFRMVYEPNFMMTTCGSFMGGRLDRKVTLTLAKWETRESCTAFSFVDVDGGVLESGDHVHWKAPSGEFIAQRYFDLVLSVRENAESLFTIYKVGAPTSAARRLRLVTYASTGVTVFGEEYTPIWMNSTGSLDLDYPSDDRFLLEVDVFGSTVLDLDPIVAFKNGDVVTLYSTERPLYSREKSKSKTFLLAGFIPLTVKASAKGTIGVVGSATAGPDRRVTLGFGPYLDLVGAANAEVNIVVADAGVHMDLRFVKVTETFKGALVLTEGDHGRFEFGGELKLQSLDGSVSVYADTAVGCGTLGLSGCHPRKTLIDWDGFTKTYAWPPTVGRDLW